MPIRVVRRAEVCPRRWRDGDVALRPTPTRPIGAPHHPGYPHPLTRGTGVTTINGWVAPDFQDVRRAFQANFDDGAEVGAAFAAYHRGEKVVDLWGGIADERTGRQWEEDSLVLVYSTTKGVTAMCAHRLAQEGRLELEAPVATYWPEFAQAGKEEVTVADLLSHRAGLAWIDGSMSFDDMVAWEPVIKALEIQAPSWPPGSAHGYHATTYGWLVGEVIRRITGVSVGTYLQRASRDLSTPTSSSDFRRRRNPGWLAWSRSWRAWPGAGRGRR
jgi:CubicO group peptidase (beta-lactamase class C family)